jgi:hypothetical protein
MVAAMHGDSAWLLGTWQAGTSSSCLQRESDVTCPVSVLVDIFDLVYTVFFR